MLKKVLVVGNCDYDGPRIVAMINENFKNLNVMESKTIDKAINLIKKNKFELVMVNRIGNEDGRNGLELIDWIRNNKDKKLKSTPIMLITNYLDKMNEAMKHGAIKGFGKEDINSSRKLSPIKKHLGYSKGH